MLKLTFKRFSMAMILLLVSCSQDRGDVKAIRGQSGIVNYGKTLPWQAKLKKGGQTLRILQLGDSHTAGDYFTDNLRTILQQRLGNGGLGLVPPNSVTGQRVATVSYSHFGWKTLTSRRDDADFSLGGIMARSTSGGSIVISPRGSLTTPQNITFTARSVNATRPLIVNGTGRSGQINPTQNRWVYNTLTAGLPLHYTAQAGDVWEVGSIRIENAKQGGAVVSALGINGSQLSHWDRWRYDWDKDIRVSQADLVILAYGTNEAFNSNLDLAETEKTWKNTIRRIKRALPQASILIIEAPESLTSTVGHCGVRADSLDAVQMMQRRIAKSEQTLFWSWQTTMGGRCSMKSWVAKGLAAKDGIHFTAQGYRMASTKLAYDLLKLAK